MKKILGLTVSALMVMGLVGGGTWAFFSDTESSTGNVLQAGTLDLHINGGDSDVRIIDTSVSNVYPGASSSNYTTLTNSGSINAELEIQFGAVTDVGGSTGEFGDSTAHLGDSGNVSISLWIDVNADGTWNSGDIDLESDGTADPYDNDSTLDSGTINSYASTTWDNVYGGADQFAVGASDRFYIDWAVSTTAGNEIQGDSATWSITFILEQGAADA